MSSTRVAVALAAALLLGGCADAPGAGERGESTSSSPGAATGSRGQADNGGSSVVPSQDTGPSVTGTGAGTGGPADAPRGSEDWRVRKPAAGTIAGYSTRVSGPEGERVDLKVSTSASQYRVTAYRLGAYRGGTGIEKTYVFTGSFSRVRSR